MTEHNVDLLLKPINNGEKILPVLKVDDRVFAYDKQGLQSFPAVRKYFLFIYSLLLTFYLTA